MALPMRMVVIALTTFVLVAISSPASAGSLPCDGDCDSNGLLEAADVGLLVTAVFEGDAACPLADVNDDGSAGAADVVSLVADIATAACGTPPSPTPTATATAMGTPASTWIPLTPLPAGPRQEHGVAALNGKVYVVGGFVGAPIALETDLVEVYDTVSGTWNTAAPLPLEAHHVALAVAGGKLYAIGGLQTVGFTPIPSLYEYDPPQNEWAARAELPAPRGAGAAATIDGLIYFVGGTEEDDPSSARHEVYNPATNSWTGLAPLPSGRDHLGAVAIGGKLYAVGGRDSLLNTAALDRYDPVSNQWEILPPMSTARGGIAVAVLHERLVVVGGEFFSPQQGVFAQVQIYDPALNQWTSLAPMPVPRHGMGAATVGDLMYVPGGGTRAGFGATAFVDALRIDLSP